MRAVLRSVLLFIESPETVRVAEWGFVTGVALTFLYILFHLKHLTPGHV